MPSVSGWVLRWNSQPASATTAIARATRAKVTWERILSTSTITARVTVADTVRVTSIISKQTAPGSPLVSLPTLYFPIDQGSEAEPLWSHVPVARGARPSQVQPCADQQQRQPD